MSAAVKTILDFEERRRASSSLDLDGGARLRPLTVIEGDALTVLREMPAGSVQSCMTSPPYWLMRDYESEPLIWGGNARCQHEFECAGKRTAHPDRSTGGQKDHHGNGQYTDTIERGAQAAKAARGAELLLGEWCTRCDAWRGSLGLEPTVDFYIEHMVQIFREVRRVLRRDGEALPSGVAGLSLRCRADPVRRARLFCSVRQHGI